VTGRKLAVAFFASFGVLAVLLVGGWWSNSLALLADAGHVVTDIAALGLSWYAARQALKPADTRRTFGYHRTGILAALINALSLFAIAGWIGYEAWHRFQSPHAVETTVMLVAAAVGMVINLVIGSTLHSHSHGNLNVRSAFLHVIGDAAASAGVIVGAVVIAVTGWHWVDPLLSVLIAVWIAFSAWHLIEESLEILMEGVPRHLSLADITRDLAGVPGVLEIHSLHVWSISRDLPCLSCHIVVADDDIPRSMQIVAACNHVLSEHHGIVHTTIQAESAQCSPEAPECRIGNVHPLMKYTAEKPEKRLPEAHEAH
jgi:cobalt-zinc-cadmium efflux system protein